MPKKPQRRKVKQRQEEKLAELSACPRCGKEATLHWAGITARGQPADSISAANGGKPEKEHLHCTSQEAGWRGNRAGKSGQNPNTEDRENSSGKRASLFPPGSLFIAIAVCKM